MKLIIDLMDVSQIDEGKFSLSREVSLSFEATSSEVHLLISNTGTGIAASDLENIFNCYWQGKLQKRDGIGLKLPII